MGLAFGVLGLAACSSSSTNCPVQPLQRSSGTFTSNPSDVSTVEFSTSLGGNPPGCFEITSSNEGPWGVFMACPTAQGSAKLEDLHAVFCADGTTSCTPIGGTLTVRAFVRPCGTGACGRVDADVDIPASSDAKPQAVSGHATLSYAESSTSSCGGGGHLFGLGDT